MDVAFLTIAELNRLYDQRELSPVEVTKALLDRIAAHDGKLHSFLLVTEEVALDEARAAERELMAGTRRGPLHGIPYALKDIIETAGIRTTGHSKLRQDHVPTADAEIVDQAQSRRRRPAGQARDLGIRARRPELGPAVAAGAEPVGHRSGCRAARRAAPGAAVAAGFVPGAVGTDTGGSVRGPAALCGLAGIKPTYGRVSRRGVFPNTFSMDHCGPLDPQRRGHRAVSAGHRRLRPATIPAARMCRCRTTRPG